MNDEDLWFVTCVCVYLYVCMLGLDGKGEEVREMVAWAREERNAFRGWWGKGVGCFLDVVNPCVGF